MWNQTKKKPAWVVRGAHGSTGETALDHLAGSSAGPESASSKAPAPSQSFPADTPREAGASAGGVGGDASSWVQSVAVCRGSDLVVSGSPIFCVIAVDVPQLCYDGTCVLYYNNWHLSGKKEHKIVFWSLAR